MKKGSKSFSIYGSVRSRSPWCQTELVKRCFSFLTDNHNSLLPVLSNPWRQAGLVSFLMWRLFGFSWPSLMVSLIFYGSILPAVLQYVFRSHHNSISQPPAESGCTDKFKACHSQCSVRRFSHSAGCWKPRWGEVKCWLAREQRTAPDAWKMM